MAQVALCLPFKSKTLRQSTRTRALTTVLTVKLQALPILLQAPATHPILFTPDHATGQTPLEFAQAHGLEQGNILGLPYGYYVGLSGFSSEHAPQVLP